jgi:hypothetical protein
MHPIKVSKLFNVAHPLIISIFSMKIIKNTKLLSTILFFYFQKNSTKKKNGNGHPFGHGDGMAPPSSSQILGVADHPQVAKGGGSPTPNGRIGVAKPPHAQMRVVGRPPFSFSLILFLT